MIPLDLLDEKLTIQIEKATAATVAFSFFDFYRQSIFRLGQF